MLRILLAGAAALLATGVAPADGAVTRLTRTDAEVHAMTVQGGQALAIVDSGSAAKPFELIATRGGRARSLGGFGLAESEFPDISVDTLGHVVVAWSRAISGGAALEVLGVDVGSSQPFGPVTALGESTGPPRLAVAGGGQVLAFPDRDGNVALISNPLGVRGQRAPSRPTTYAITASAPARRHLPLDIVIGPDGPLVLDLVQTRELTEVRVIGAGAPTIPVTAAPGVRDIPAGMAADDERVVAAYMSSGRVVLATPRANGTWLRRRLPGPGGGRDAPAVMLVGGDVVVAYDQRVAARRGSRAARQIFVATLSGQRLSSRRLTRTRSDEGAPIAASDPAGEAYLAWTRTTPVTRRHTALLTRVK